jgi:LacI family transcriptional regulator
MKPSPPVAGGLDYGRPITTSGAVTLPKDSLETPKKPRRASTRPTLMQVAKVTGLSPSTVSAVLNQRPHCWASKETRQQIQDAARRLGYRPNMVARSLRGGKTQTVGLITAAMNVDTAITKVSTFEAAARHAGYVSMIAFNPNDPAMEDKLLLALWDRGVDGILVFPSETGPHTELANRVADGFPLVTIDGAGRLDFETDDISTDYFLAGQLQTRYLLEHGRRRLAQAMASPTCYVVEQLRAGALGVAAEAGCAPPRLLNLDLPADGGSQITQDLYRQVRAFLAEHGRHIDGFISHDQVAATAVHAALELGIRVPQDLAIIGFDNTATASNCVIPLTTVAQRAEDVGAQAFALLAERMEQGRVRPPSRRVRIEPEVVVRASTGA